MTPRVSEVYSTLLTPLSTDEQGALRASIEAEGVREPIVIDENGYILDGHNRFAIATELGIDPPTRILSGLTDLARPMGRNQRGG